jgi:hypothetical protein
MVYSQKVGLKLKKKKKNPFDKKIENTFMNPKGSKMTKTNF